MKNVLLVLGCIFVLLTVTGAAQQAPHVEVFIGGQYSRIDLGDAQLAVDQFTNANALPHINIGDHANAYGWDTSVAENLNRWFGVVVDVGGTYMTQKVDITTITNPTTPPDIIRSNNQFYSFMGGPQITMRSSRDFQPFVRAMFGGAKAISNANETVGGVQQFFPGLHTSDLGWSLSIGGGVDVHFRGPVYFRVVGDYVRTALFDESQRNIKVAFGISYRVGHATGSTW